MSEGADIKGKVRLQRLLADAGVAARRACEEMIEEGRVRVNGATVTRLPVFVDPENDLVTVDGRPVQRGHIRRLYLMVNKPERVLVTTGDEPGMGRTTVMDLVDHPSAPRLYPIGRLDFNTAGLVLLTNDGTLANRLTHPRYGVPKTYRAVVKDTLTTADLPGLTRRIVREIHKDDRMAGRIERAPKPGPAAAGRIELALEGSDQGRSVLVITLREGRTGNIGSILAGAGVKVRKLERIAIGPLELKGLGRGRWRELERGEIAVLKAAARGKLMERGEGPARRVRRVTPVPAGGRSGGGTRASRPSSRALAARQERRPRRTDERGGRGGGTRGGGGGSGGGGGGGRGGAGGRR